MFRSRSTGRLVSFATDDAGNSWTKDKTGRIILRPKNTDIQVRGSITQRTPKARGKGLEPRTDRTAYVSGMESNSRMTGAKPANPMQMLRVGRALAPKLDGGKIPLEADANWFGPVPKGKTQAQMTGKLRSTYGGKFGLKPNGPKIRGELSGLKAAGLSLRHRRIAAKLIRAQPPLLRVPKA